MNIEKVASNIRKFRELRNYTQEVMAVELGMTQAGYSRIEKGEVEISIQKLDKIAKVLETNVENILGFDEKIVFNQQHSNNYSAVKEHSQVNINVDLKEIHQLYDRLLAEKDKRIAALEKRIERLESKQ